jgi:hypothetical protein
MTAKAVLETLAAVWRQLAQLQAPMAVMGGLALSVWRHVRITQDVEILIALDAGNEPRLLNLLQSSGFRTKTSPAIRSLGPTRLLQLLFEPQDAFIDIQVDLLLADSKYHRAALDRRVRVHFEEIEEDLFVLRCEDLIIHKLLANRIQDRVDTIALLRANAELIDFAYLNQWLRSLGLLKPFSDDWSEAFPDIPIPSEFAE